MLPSRRRSRSRQSIERANGRSLPSRNFSPSSRSNTQRLGQIRSAALEFDHYIFARLKLTLNRSPDDLAKVRAS